MRQFLIVLIIILILAGVGGGVWWYLQFNRGGPNVPAAPVLDDSLGQNFPISDPIIDPTPLPDPNQPNPNPSQTNDSVAPTPDQPSGLSILNSRAASGAMIISAATSSASDKLIFLERETGLVVEVDLRSGEKRSLARLPVRGAIEAGSLVLNSGKLTAWFSTLAGESKNYFQATVTLATSTTELNLPEPPIESLSPQIRELVLSPARDQFFTLETVGEDTIGKVTTIKTGKTSLVFNSKLNQWLVAWPEKSLLGLTSRPADNLPGYLYLVNLKNNSADPILSGINGLVTLISPSGQKILYSKIGNLGLELSLYIRSTKETRLLTVKTLANKCAWNNNSTFVYCAAPQSVGVGFSLVNRLLGGMKFNDLVWKINADTGTSQLVWAETAGLGDATQLLVTKDERKVIFIERETGQLRQVELKDDLTPVAPTTRE
ncbi:MAG: hypothetical protein AAB455_00115 [Patescibacteria group bacterium]